MRDLFNDELRLWRKLRMNYIKIDSFLLFMDSYCRLHRELKELKILLTSLNSQNLGYYLSYGIILGLRSYQIYLLGILKRLISHLLQI